MTSLTYTPELGDKICARLADGESLRTVCKDEGMPCKSTVFNWLRTIPEFRANYGVAKVECADAYIEEVIDIADDGSNDWMLSNKPNSTGYVMNGEHIQRSRVRIDTRKWIASKMNPKKYGEKVEATMLGPNGGPVQHTVEWVSGAATAPK